MTSQRFSSLNFACYYIHVTKKKVRGSLKIPSLKDLRSGRCSGMGLMLIGSCLSTLTVIMKGNRV